MATPITIYPNPPILAGFPTAADPPLAAPMPADLDDPYVAGTVREGGFLTAPRSAYSTTPKTGTATSTIGLVITLHYSATVYEVVYQLGAFTPLYLAGSTVNLGTGAYSLVRAGGFPPGVTVDAIGCVPCPPCPPIPTSGQAMRAIYSVDFTILPAQDLTAAGSYALDGKTWWAKGPLISGGTAQTCAVVPGVGLRMTRPDPISNTTDFTAAGTYNNRVMCMDISQLADFNLQAPLFVTWRVTSNFTASQNEAGSRLTYGGLMSFIPSVNPVVLSSGLGLSLRRVDASNLWWRNPLNASAIGLTMPVQSDVFGDVVQGVYRYVTTRFMPMVGAWNGTALQGPDNLNLISVNASNRPFDATGLGVANPWFYFVCEKNAQNGSFMDYALTHLSIFQPKIP